LLSLAHPIPSRFLCYVLLNVQSRLQRTKAIFRFFKEQLHQSHRIKEKDQANLEKTVTVFQEAIQALKAENEQVMSPIFLVVCIVHCFS
jgi:glycerol-3-phosphate O-acyltransferase